MNQLFFGDNLDVLRESIKDKSIDLIYLDPPFNSKANYNLLFKTPNGHESDAQITAFEDTWHWGEQAEREFNEILYQENTHVAEMIRAFRQFLGVNDVMAYLTMMTNRLIELHRVLKPTGSLYLHCDPTASHYLKMLMDAVFGPENFLNEIIWHYHRWSAQTNRFQRIHDVIFFYSKSKNSIFNMLYEDYTAGTLKRWKGMKRKTTVLEDGSLYQEEDTEGVKGANMGDVWDISIINANAKERLGYPTQKPIALLERIINASSNLGDVVLDPFCGCGTTIAAAQKYDREWIGIDITHLAISLIEKRLRDSFRDVKYEVHGTPKDIDGARDLAKRDKYQFQWWACSLVNAQPYMGKKKGADSGIDGLIYFQDDKTVAKKIIVSVKGGEHINVAMIRDLGHVVDREKAEIGLFVTLTEPTKPMKEEASQAGFYKSPYKDSNFPKIQILTIENLMNRSEYPRYPDLAKGGLTFKKAKTEIKKGTTESLF